MFPRKTQSISLIILLLLAGILISPLGGKVVSSWAGDTVKLIHVSGVPGHFQNTHISGVGMPAVDLTDLGTAWDEVAALPAHVSGAESLPMEDPHVSGALTEIADLPDSHVSGAVIAAPEIMGAHFSGAKTSVSGIVEARVSGSETQIAGSGDLVRRVSFDPPATEQRITGEQGVIASIPDNLDMHLSGATSSTGTTSLLAGRELTLEGTDSQGNYSHGAAKSEGSKSKVSPHHSGAETSAPKSGNAGASYSHGASGGHRGNTAAHGGSHGAYSRSYKSHGGSPSHGGHGQSGHDTDFFSHILKFKYVLNLTDEQIEAIRDKEFEFNKVKLLAEAEHTIAHIELNKWAHTGNVNETRIRGLADEISAIKSKKIHAMAEGKIALLNILTEEQRRQIHKMYLHHH